MRPYSTRPGSLPSVSAPATCRSRMRPRSTLRSTKFGARRTFWYGSRPSGALREKIHGTVDARRIRAARARRVVGSAHRRVPTWHGIRRDSRAAARRWRAREHRSAQSDHGRSSDVVCRRARSIRGGRLTDAATQMPLVAVYADESCLGNGREGSNPGGAAGLIEYFNPATERLSRFDYWVSEPATTNNRMALRSAIEAIRIL